MKKKVVLNLRALSREAAPESTDIFNDEKRAEDEGELIEFITEAEMKMKGEMVELSYDEGALSGLEGSSVLLVFDTGKTDTLTMIRSGKASVTMVFSPGLRHTYQYDNEILPFSLTLMTHSLKNTLLAGGSLEAYYTIELPGGGFRTHLSITIRDAEIEEA